MSSAENETLETQRRACNEADRAHGDAKTHKNKSVTAYDKVKHAIKTNKVAIQRIEDKISHLREDLELATPQTGLLEQHRENLRVAQDKVQADEETFKDSVTAKDNLNSKQRDLKAQLDAAGEEVSIVKTKIVHYSSFCYFPMTFMAAYGIDQLLKQKK